VTRIATRPSASGRARLLCGFAVAAGLLAGAPCFALDAARPDVASFVAGMSGQYGFEPDALRAVLAQAETRQSILDAMTRPAEKTLTWTEYRARFLTERRIVRGTDVYRDQCPALEKASERGGVPPQLMLAIVGVETLYGENTGRHRVIDALATLAFDYPPRSEFFRGELEQFLLLSREEGMDPLAPTGSYAGAMGIPQFMPSSIRKFAVDGDGDLRRDLWRDWDDVFASVANYLAAHGWKAGEPVMVPADASAADLAGLDTAKPALTETVGSLQKRGIRFETTLPADAPAMLVGLSTDSGVEYRVGFTNFYAITRYNRSPLYASAVSDLADAIEEARRRSLPADAPAAPGSGPQTPQPTVSLPFATK
jgi:membrane-bound lytic murein transglycosylase B